MRMVRIVLRGVNPLEESYHLMTMGELQSAWQHESTEAKTNCKGFLEDCMVCVSVWVVQAICSILGETDLCGHPVDSCRRLEKETCWSQLEPFRFRAVLEPPHKHVETWMQLD